MICLLHSAALVSFYIAYRQDWSAVDVLRVGCHACEYPVEDGAMVVDTNLDDGLLHEAALVNLHPIPRNVVLIDYFACRSMRYI